MTLERFWIWTDSSLWRLTSILPSTTKIPNTSIRLPPILANLVWLGTPCSRIDEYKNFAHWWFRTSAVQVVQSIFWSFFDSFVFSRIFHYSSQGGKNKAVVLRITELQKFQTQKKVFMTLSTRWLRDFDMPREGGKNPILLVIDISSDKKCQNHRLNCTKKRMYGDWVKRKEMRKKCQLPKNVAK